MSDQNSPKVVSEAALETFRSYKDLADRAVAQLEDEQLHTALDANTNCIAVIMNHLAGNMRSRWTDFLTSDGEKPWRNRDAEFIDDLGSREELDAFWEEGWSRLFEAIESLTDEDLSTIVNIRGKPHTVVRAIDRQLGHYAYHVGQILLIGRILAGEKWTMLTIPRGDSENYNQRVWGDRDPNSL